MQRRSAVRSGQRDQDPSLKTLLSGRFKLLLHRLEGAISMFWCDVVGKAGEIHGSFSTEVESQPGRRLTVRFSLSPSSPVSSRETATRDLKVATPHREAALLWWSSRPASLEAERAAIASPVAVFISIAVVGNIKHKRLLTGPDARKGMSGWRGGRTSCQCQAKGSCQSHAT